MTFREGQRSKERSGVLSYEGGQSNLTNSNGGQSKKQSHLHTFIRLPS